MCCTGAVARSQRQLSRPLPASAGSNSNQSSTGADTAIRRSEHRRPVDGPTVPVDPASFTNEVNVVFVVTDKHGKPHHRSEAERFPSCRRQQAPGDDSQLPRRSQPAAASRTAHRRQQLRARPLQVRAGIGHRVPEPDGSLCAMTALLSWALTQRRKSRRTSPTMRNCWRMVCTNCAPAAARRSTTRFTSPAATSC